MRLFAGERLAEAGEQQQFVQRHALWALALAEREGERGQLDREVANLRAAHNPLSPEQRLRFCVALLPLWLRRIDLEEAHRRFLQALDGAGAPTRERAAALLAVSAIDYRAGALACGEEHVREADAIAREPAATEPALAHAAALRRIRDRPRRSGSRRQALRAGPQARPARGPRGRGGAVGLLAGRGTPQRGTTSTEPKS